MKTKCQAELSRSLRHDHLSNISTKLNVTGLAEFSSTVEKPGIALSPKVETYRRFFVQGVATGQDDDTLTWLGTNTLCLHSKSTSLLIDPYFSRLPGALSPAFFYRKVAPDLTRIEQCLPLTGMDKADAILLTHTHFDHALDAPAVCRLTGSPLLYTPPLLFHKLADVPHPFYTRLLTDGLTFAVGDFDIRVFKGEHMPFPLPTAPLEKWINRHQHKPGALHYAWQYTADAAYSYHITRGNTSLFIMGSAGLPHSSLAEQTADILILSVGGLDLLPRSYCDRLLRHTVDVLHPRAVWLSHWDDFTLPLSEPIHWLKQSNRIVDYIIARNRKEGIPTYLLPPGKAIVPQALKSASTVPQTLLSGSFSV